MARDDFSEAIKRLLAERAAYRCSNPDCRRITIGASREDSTKVIKPGIAAHIHAASRGGPRYFDEQTSDERSAASNGIWLCATCATMIDKNNGIDYSPALLRSWKDNHDLQTFSELSGSSANVGLTGWCEESGGSWKMFVKNAGMVPYYDCVIYGFKLENFDEPFADIEIAFGTIPPRQTLDDTVDFEFLNSEIFGHPMVALEYTDSEGAHWRREVTGKLESIEYRRPFD